VTPVDVPEVHIIGPDGLPVGVVRRPPPPPARIWLHTLLFLVTCLSTTVLGAALFGPHADTIQSQPLWRFLVTPRMVAEILSGPAHLADGLLFSVPLMLILLCHEFGHYFACRAHHMRASLPYFLPVPFGIGTLGAFIRIRTPFLNRKELMDVGAWGPIAGFATTFPVLVVGIALSRTVVITDAVVAGGYFAEPLAFRALNLLMHPEVAAGADLLAHPIAMAGWFGLLVTMINLLPFGQLDGGHVTYALLGRKHRMLVLPLLAAVFLLGFLFPGWWIWMAIALAMGLVHPRLPGEDGPLDARSRVLGWACIIIFVLSFMVIPMA